MTDTLEALTRRIGTTKDLEAIVRSMKALSTASIVQYERTVASMSQYMRNVELGLSVVLRQSDALPREHPLMDGAVMAILFGSDHSLCGGFNEEIFRAATAAQRAAPPQRPWLWLAVGARAAISLEAAGQTATGSMFLPGTADGLVETSHRILLMIDDWRASRSVTQVLLFHNRQRENVATPHRIQLLPLDPDWLNGLARRQWQSRTQPIFTMAMPELFSALAREYLFANIFRSGAESLASEHATRLAAMQSALRNIEEHLQEMTAEHRRKRQNAITSELLDIVSVYETLRKRQ